MKPYPLRLEELTNMYNDEPMADYSKGHHDLAAFKQAVADHHGCRPEELYEAQHEWWRWVPTGRRDYKLRQQQAEAGDQGAFPVTVIYS